MKIKIGTILFVLFFLALIAYEIYSDPCYYKDTSSPECVAWIAEKTQVGDPIGDVLRDTGSGNRGEGLRNQCLQGIDLYGLCSSVGIDNP